MPIRPPSATPRKKYATPYRGSSSAQGYGAEHRRWRKAILERDPICMIRVKCYGAPSTVADHIKPVRQHVNPSDAWTMANGQGCCDCCHNWKRATLDKRSVG